MAHRLILPWDWTQALEQTTLQPIVDCLLHGKRLLLNPQADKLPPLRPELAALLPLNDAICRNWQRGQCRLGTQCSYRHMLPPKTIVCKHWLRGLCKKQDGCEFLHEFDLSKMPQCHFFLTFGQCSNPDCQFQHTEAPKKSRECQSYTHHGFCLKGPNCNRLHDSTTKTICADWLAGFCMKGPLCSNAHPRFDTVDTAEADLEAERRAQQQAEEQGQGQAPQRGGGGFDRNFQNGGGGGGARFDNSNNDRSTNNGHSSSRPAFNAGGAGPTGDRPDRSNRDMSSVLCFKCNTMGHYANNCTQPRAPGQHQQQQSAPRFGTQGQMR